MTNPIDELIVLRRIAILGSTAASGVHVCLEEGEGLHNTLAAMEQQQRVLAVTLDAFVRRLDTALEGHVLPDLRTIQQECERDLYDLLPDQMTVLDIAPALRILLARIDGREGDDGEEDRPAATEPAGAAGRAG